MDRWSLGTLIWMPIFVLLLLILTLAAVVFFLGWTKHPGTRNGRDALSLAGIAVVAGLCLILGTAWGMWPYQTEYHKWIETTGEVQQIESRLLSDGNGGMNERYVVTFEDNELRSCDDSRCTQVEEGDILTLQCKRAWQWSGTHGYDCSYVKHEDK